jgi:NADH-quinone oxidoreductase subunit L
MDDLRSLAILIVVAPLVGAVISGLFGRYIGRVISHCLTTLLVGISFAASSYMLHGFVTSKYQLWDQALYVWGRSGNLDIRIGFMLDRLSVLMITVVSFVSFMVHIYSIGYMHDDKGYQRFFSYISMFTFGMLILVMANNFVQLFFGWEAVGVMSYLLIGFWFKRPTAIFANLKAFLVNRLGDFGFLLGIAAVLYYCGSLQYNQVFASVPALASNQSAIDLICICLFIGAMAKSAQIPLHVWLPDSMEGPTPISALIHAATMVTAGVFMVARMSPIFEHSERVLNFIIIIGSCTCLFMGILAVVQRDIKRIIAYSTLSQLGYMVVALGVSAYSAGIFHLVTHAFFKALLFLGAGSVIIAMHHDQDIFSMGNLSKYMPVTFMCMLMGTLAIVGLPGMSGFYSKDLIIEAVRESNLPAAGLAYYVVLGSVFITALYSFRLFFVVFYTQERMSDEVRAHLHETSAVIWVPLVLLAIPSIIIGSLMVKYIVHGFFEGAIFVRPEHDVIATFAQNHFHSVLDMFVKGFIGMPFILAVLGFFIAWLCYMKYPKIPVVIQKDTKLLVQVLNNKYGFDLLNEKIIMPVVKGIGDAFWRFGDIMCIDGLMVNGSAKSVGYVAKLVRKIQTGYLYHYAFAMIAGFFVLALWLLVLR